MDVSLIVGNEVVEMLTVNPEVAWRAARADFGMPVAPVLEFISKWSGNYPPDAVAHGRTGRDVKTGGLSLGIGIRNRNNGTVRFESDLWKLPYDLSNEARELLSDYWRLENQETPRRLLKRMEHHFGRTHFCFDALEGQTDDWKGFLTVVLSEPGNYQRLEVPNCER